MPVSLSFAQQLINWYSTNKRDLPWRKTPHPYPVWLSEIILQQTRVAQGLPYWQRFMEAFPTVHDFARADEDTVLRLWQGLGYYSRARNAHHTAKYVSEALNGEFPSTYKEILRLKGIGPYTAAAIASICFKEATPVVDGNVFRFASRYFGVTEDISLSKTRSLFEDLLKKHIDPSIPGVFNQAMMEYGARICTPQPKCDVCVYQAHCYALARGTQHSLPVKTKKIKTKIRHLHYIVFSCEASLLMKQREDKDIWQGLYDFHHIEGPLEAWQILQKVAHDFGLEALQVSDTSSSYNHVLTHQKIKATFIKIALSKSQAHSVIQKTNLCVYSLEEILNLPKPKLIVNYLTKEVLT